MTSQAGAPGATAVYLFREQITDDERHTYAYYFRVKVLTDGGKEYANVELPFISGQGGYSVDGIVGRTIHPDGTITPFTGKPYEKLIEKTGGYKVKSKVFTMPAVEVGSILEYRYKLIFDDYYYTAPEWEVQKDIYTRKAHYNWLPTTHELQNDDEGMITSIAWTPVLPPGAKVIETPRTGRDGVMIDLVIANVPALPREEFMPPPASLSYRVMFYYTGFRTENDYWKNRGKRWSSTQNDFIGPKSGVKDFVAKTISPSDSSAVKLKKLYDVVESFDNTQFSREHTAREDKAQGFKEVSSTDDILARKRGTDDQLAELFIAMARAAGFKAYAMGVSNRSKRIFIPAYLSTSQLDDIIAVVNVDGKEQWFDPGQRYCAYGHLAWHHAYSAGLRQTENGVALSGTPGEGPKVAHIQRVADLTLDEHGEATGTIKVTEEGDAALRWRQEGLETDDVEMNHRLRTYMEHVLPGGMEVRVTDVENLSDPDKPLIFIYHVKGAVGSPTGKRLLIPASLFQANAKPVFPSATREQAVYLHYPSYTQDAVRYKYPASLAVEAAPANDSALMNKQAGFEINSRQTPGSITIFRNFSMGTYLILPTDYPALRTFYEKLEAKDQDTLIFVRASETKPETTASTTPPAP